MHKVLISSFAISPLQGSEPGLGWDLTSRIGQHFKATVLFGSEKRTFQRDFSIDHYIREHGEIPNTQFIWVEPPPFAKKVLKLHDKIHISFFYYWAYKLWQKQAYKVSLELDKTEKFDVVHQYNMIGFREPGYLWKLKKPFIWGPVAGTVNIPLKYWKILGPKGSMKIAVQNMANYAQLILSGKVRAAGKSSTILMAASSSEKKNLLKYFPGKDMPVVNETGASYSFPPHEKIRNGKLNMVWSGKHFPRKALPFLLHALKAMSPDIHCHLDVLGEGSETARWKKMAAELGVMDKITWHGWLDRQKGLQIMRNADVFVFTSLREGTSTVVNEAVALGLPVICMDVCGMADVVDDSCGIKIILEAPGAMIDNLAMALEKLYKDPALLERLSAGALVRSKGFSWEVKVPQIAALYEKAIANA